MQKKCIQSILVQLEEDYSNGDNSYLFVDANLSTSTSSTLVFKLAKFDLILNLIC